MNDLDLRLEVVSRSCKPLRYIRRWISRKPLEIEAWFQRISNRKWHMGYQMVTWPMKSRDRRRCCEAVRPAMLATAWLLVVISVWRTDRQMDDSIARSGGLWETLIICCRALKSNKRWCRLSPRRSYNTIGYLTCMRWKADGLPT